MSDVSGNRIARCHAVTYGSPGQFAHDPGRPGDQEMNGSLCRNCAQLRRTLDHSCGFQRR